jgi:uncharacterized protein YjaZ
MALNVHILKASGHLTGDLHDRILASLTAAARKAAAVLTLKDIDVVVAHSGWGVIPRLGVNGYAFDAHHIRVTVNVEHEHFRANLDPALQSLLVHELHHCARAAARGMSHGRTYGGSLVAEGLACAFEEEMGFSTPFYAVECNGDALERFSAKAKEHIDKPYAELPVDWQRWMFGVEGDADFPYQCGYSTGYAVVKDWLRRNGLKASCAAGVEPDEPLARWRAGEFTPGA